MELETLALTTEGGVATITLTRGDALNSMVEAFWTDFPKAFAAIDADTTVRAVVIASTGRHFSAGLDLAWAAQSLTVASGDAGRSREAFRRHILRLQEAFSVVDRCRVPVIAVVQGGCIGGGVDLITACDLRVGTQDCFFSILEVDLAIVADVGTLQRLPYLLPQGLVRELAYTGRRFTAVEAKHWGFLNRVEADHAAALASGQTLAAEIAAKSPLAITGIKTVLNHGRDVTIAQGLDHVATWNAGMLQGGDLPAAMAAQRERQATIFADLEA